MSKAASVLHFLIGITLLGSCQAPKESESQEMEFNLAVYEKNNCYGERCANVSFSYPEFDLSHPMAPLINAHVEEQLKMYLQFGVFDDYESLDAAVDDFFDVFEQMGEDVSHWSVEVEARVTYLSDQLLSIQFTNTSFTGGNHPNEHLLFLNFDLDQRHLMISEEVVFDKEKLLEKVEKAFRKHHQVADTKTLEEDGRFFLEEDKIFLPFSIGYRDHNLVLYYNHYEISPYEMGATELVFPLEDLEGIVLIK